MKQYLQRFDQSLNLRTLYGLIALGCLLGISLLGRLDAATQRAADVRAEAETRLVRHGGAIDEALWRERAASAETELTFWKSTHWSGSTAGVIAAELEDAITQVIRSAELDIVVVNVEAAPSESQSGSILRFRFSTESSRGDGVAKTLAAFGAHDPILVIDEINAVFDENSHGRFSASGYAPISLDAPTQEDQ